MSAIKTGFIGYGGSAQRIHTPLIQAVPELDLVAVVPTSDRARAAAADAGLAVAETPAALAELGVRLAVIATPDGAHAQNIEEALDAGLDLVVEKPITARSDDAERLVARARDEHRLLVPFQNRRWDNGLLTVRRLIDSGKLGTVVRFYARISRWSPDIGATWRDQARPGTLDGRLADIGSHLVDQAYHLFGPVETVYAEVNRFRAGAPVNDDAFLVLRHTSGVISHLAMGSLFAPPQPSYIVQGLDGGYSKMSDDPQMTELAGGVQPSSDGWGRYPDAEPGVYVGRDGVPTVVPNEPADWADFYRGVAAALDGAPAPVDPADAVAVLHILEAAARSGQENAVVRVGS